MRTVRHNLSIWYTLNSDSA